MFTTETMKYAVSVDATCYAAFEIATNVEGGDQVVATFADEEDAKIFAEIKNFARYHGNR